MLNDMTSCSDLPYGRQVEQFHARIGRVVTSAALMELWLLRLACVFDNSPGEQELAGRHGSDLVASCRRQLASLSSELRSQVEKLLDDACALIEARNAIVHNVWPEPGREYGHRPIRKSKRNQPTEWIQDGFVTGDDLDQLYGDIKGIIERLMRLLKLIDN
jgi:hypothetical protein